MKFTVLPDYSGGVFKTVSEQLQELYPYIMGKYTQGVVDENGTVLGSKIESNKEGVNTGITGEDGKLLNTFLVGKCLLLDMSRIF